MGFCYLSFKSNETTEKNLNVSLARPRENSSKCERYLSDDEAQSTRVKEISNEYQNGTSKIAKKRKSYHNMADVILKNNESNTEVSDEPQRKKPKQVASNSSSQKGESSVENTNLSKEISGERTFECEIQTTDTIGSCHGVAEYSDVERISYSGLDPSYGDDDEVLLSEYRVTAGSDVDEDDVTVVSETSWNDPSDVIADDILVDDFKVPSFRRKE